MTAVVRAAVGAAVGHRHCRAVREGGGGRALALATAATRARVLA